MVLLLDLVWLNIFKLIATRTEFVCSVLALYFIVLMDNLLTSVL